MDPIIQLFVDIFPIRTFRVVENFLTIVYDLQLKNRNSRYYKSIVTIILCAAYSMIRLPVCSILFHDKPLSRLIYGDYTNFNDKMDHIFLVILFESFNFMTIVFYECYYLCAQPTIYTIFSRLSNKYLPLKDYKGHNARTLSVTYFIVTINSFQLFTVLSNFWMAVTVYYLYTILHDNWSEASNLSILSWILFYVNGLVNFITIQSYASGAMLAGSTSLWLMLTVRIYLHQVKQMVRRSKNFRTLLRTMSMTCLTFRYLFQINQTLGPVFSFFLVICVPLNCYANIVIFFNQYDIFFMLAYILLSHQMIGIALIHFMIPMITRKMHSSGRIIQRIAVLWDQSKKERLDLKDRLRIHMFVEKYHTTRKYALQYFNVANISTGSFMKCALLYGEFVMFFYRIRKF